MDQNSDKGNTILHYAALNNNVDLVKQLLKCGTNANIQNSSGTTALHLASRHGFLEVAECLLKHGADGKIEDLDRNTPLHDAAAYGEVGIVELILSKDPGALKVKNTRSQTPMQLAASQGHAKVAQILNQVGGL